MLTGKILNERYKILHTIGGGGMADVYLGEDLILNRKVAIKVLKMEYSNNTEFIERFRREAESAISLSNDHIVNIFDVGEENNIYYMVMEYVEGDTLKEHIQYNGPLSASDAVAIMLQLTSALSHAHTNGIIHRDVKPQNVLMDQYGNVKITDFGIARALSSTQLTKTNDVLGSVHYLSPEQARGGTATKKSDIYSLGIVLFELLTGRLPFSGESAVSVALKHMQTETPYVRSFQPSVPQSLENVVLKATAKNPLHRYQTIDEMENDLKTVLNAGRQDEERFTPPVEEGEDTKVMPVVPPNLKFEEEDGNTIVNSEQQAKDKPNKKSKKWMIFLISFSALVLIAAIIALFVLPKMLIPDDIEIPDVAGKTYEEAFNELTDLGLEVERDTVHDEEVEEGLVVKTSPRAGNTVKEGATVTIVTSMGQEKIEFPDYVGSSFEQTKKLLESNGYQEVIGYQKDSDKPEGEIIAQIQPEPGEEIIPENTRVIFDVSNGPPTVSLQSVEGWSLEDVQDYAKTNNLSLVTEEEFSDDVREGRIIQQNPSPNTELEVGDEFRVVVSKGPDLKPVTKTETFEVKYDPSEGEQAPDNDDNTQDENNENNSSNEPVGQEVVIYIGDANRNINNVFHDETIYADTTYEIEVTVNPGEKASYRVVRDGETYIEQSVPYEE
ncbi:Stk1 family PASTA domain-containing Ser/Thr kinase [Allobacillus sp. GCM10007491]|uniref:Serine/threonine-protein kinase PrkC n=1 Tax=Allobacillus saliphilus TaxID=2912308 RepID=A0A941CSD4_9BACI|nr:Stk1 family PASTA domain-containing Ser/Thr kinase [Allobacillus saliphilus]